MADTESWTCVSKKRRCAPGSPVPPVPPSGEAAVVMAPISSKGGKLPTFKVVPSAGYDTAFEVVRVLEKGPLRGQLLSLRPLGDSNVLLLPSSYDVVEELERIKSLDGKPLNLERLNPEDRKHRLVAHDYHTSFETEVIEDHPQVISATRMRRWDKRPTRQVLITVKGEPFNSIDLGWYGRYDVRTYIPDPLRCFKCQRYGHHQARCTAKQHKCGICSMPHATETCLDKFKAGTETVPKCPNCGKKHHAWNTGCAVRQVQAIASKERTEKQQDFIPAPPQEHLYGAAGNTLLPLHHHHLHTVLLI
ncbi:uncharacterized protein LOC143039893 [Oratosquilla oratoria]|uniref:uncharacterized protein LOC143039893 n=1 Tax=Oratosquilla oratoria TaxID=337810 RepID=UPI003F76CE9E